MKYAMSPGIDLYEESDAFWTPVAGIYRHDQLWPGHTGFYHVIAIRTEALNFFCDLRESDYPAWSHRYAVVDDFGNLVRVDH
jgi:hypothetical protein